MLFLCSESFSDVFAAVSFALGFSKYPDAIVSLNKIIFGTLNFVAFIATSYSAAEVSREDERLRKRIKSVAFNIYMQKDTKEQGDLLRRFVQSKAEIVLSAGGLENVKAKVLEQQRKNLILHEVDKGVKKKDIALKFGFLPNSLSTIIKNSDKMQNFDSSNSCSKHLKTCVCEDVDKAVLKWIHTMRDKNVPISGPFIIEKALQFAKALGYDEFRGSNGWLEKFKRRHGIMSK
ncbi:Tigger transposable element-derived protein 4, partial [Araneus ventricosus]